MTTYRERHGGMYVETKRVIRNERGELEVKQVTCCCEAPAATMRGCAVVAGNKTPCRCQCHPRKREQA